MNCKGPHLAERFLHNLYPCFYLLFAQLVVIPKTRIKFYGNSNCYRALLNYNSCKKSKIKEEAALNIPFCKISWWKNVNKKGKKFFLLNIQYCQFEQDSWKNRTLFMKKSWIWTFVKYLENLPIEKICCNPESC